VDRYGQGSGKVRVLTYYGLDNQIDGIVLDVLIRKHKKIHSSLGISVPVPVPAEQVIEAILRDYFSANKPAARKTSSRCSRTTSNQRKEEIHSDWEFRGRPRETFPHDVCPGNHQGRRSRLSIEPISPRPSSS